MEEKDVGIFATGVEQILASTKNEATEVEKSMCSYKFLFCYNLKNLVLQIQKFLQRYTAVFLLEQVKNNIGLCKFPL